jgi:hypothetical protein
MFARGKRPRSIEQWLAELQATAIYTPRISRRSSKKQLVDLIAPSQTPSKDGVDGDLGTPMRPSHHSHSHYCYDRDDGSDRHWIRCMDRSCSNSSGHEAALVEGTGNADFSDIGQCNAAARHPRTIAPNHTSA